MKLYSAVKKKIIDYSIRDVSLAIHILPIFHMIQPGLKNSNQGLSGPYDNQTYNCWLAWRQSHLSTDTAFMNLTTKLIL